MRLFIIIVVLGIFATILTACGKKEPSAPQPVHPYEYNSQQATPPKAPGCVSVTIEGYTPVQVCVTK